MNSGDVSPSLRGIKATAKHIHRDNTSQWPPLSGPMRFRSFFAFSLLIFSSIFLSEIPTIAANSLDVTDGLVVIPESILTWFAVTFSPTFSPTLFSDLFSELVFPPLDESLKLYGGRLKLIEKKLSLSITGNGSFTRKIGDAAR